ncbi:MAG: T9SS type A sorting domain-containing protein [Fluviicola sp.]|nr:T9SS type A sorting domain-containing protein [Fluviicola sp.]
MTSQSTLFKSILVVITFICHNFLYSQFNSKQLCTDISEQMIDFDLNNDGQLDIISVGYDSIDNQLNHLYYFENDSGTFLNPVSIGRVANEIEFEFRKADIDNDGFIDLLFIDKEVGKVNLFKNLTNGSLSNPIQLIGQFHKIDGFEIVDMDNDNLLDIVASSLLTDEIVWFKNLDLFAFAPAEIIVSLTSGSYTIKITTTDYNQDGYEDLFYISQITKQLMQVTNLGNGLFSNPIQLDFYYDLPNNLYIPIINNIDINQDGTNDLVVNMVEFSDNVFWYIIDSGTISPRSELTATGISTLYEPFITKTVDINLDGFNELVIADWNDIYYFANNNGVISSTPIALVSNLSSFITNLVFEDVNNDTFPDIIVNDANSGISLYLNNTSANFNLVQTLSPEVKLPIFSTLSDVDSDGLLDVLYFKEKSLNIYWMKNMGDNVFGPSQEFIALSNAYILPAYLKKFYLEDIDNDSIDDLITLKGSNTNSGYIQYYKGFGNMTFQSAIPISPIPTSPLSFEVYNFNLFDVESDNDLDVTYCSYNSDQFGYYENLGNGNFSTSQVIDNTCNQPVNATALDIDDDSDIDFITFSNGDNKLRLIENFGNGSFSVPTLITTNLNAVVYQLFIDDVDGDSIDDLITSEQNSTIEKIGWYKNLGNGTFSTFQLISNSFNSPISEVLDYDLDGDPDIICSSNYYILPIRGTFLLENLGNGNFLGNGPRLLTEASSNYSKGDTDNDGDVDVISCKANRLFLSINNQNCKTTVTGKVFFDQNINGILDSAEIGLNLHPVLTNPINNYIFTDSAGKYTMSFFDTTQLHTISTQTYTNWGITSNPPSYTVSVNTQFNQIDSLNFGLYPSQLIDSISSNLVGGFPRCNDTINYWLNIRNLGSTITSGLISLDLDSNLTYIISDPLPDSISNGNLFWNYDSLFYFSDKMINLYVSTPNFLLMGDELKSILDVSVIDSLNNITFLSSDTLSQILVCAYDPNDKISNPNGIGYQGYIDSLSEIKYLVRFQNTGNDTASVIVVKDQLDSLLDWSTFEPICGSHNFTSSVDETGLVTFIFSNINLPDSNVNELESHGFVYYKIKAIETVPVGSTISNFAEIYFDLNPPVLTNYKLLTIFDCNSVFQNATHSTDQFCNGDSIQFGLNFPETNYNWSYNIDTTVYSSNVVTFIASNTGVNTTFVHAENEFCSVDSIIEFTVLPVPNQSEQQIQICQGDSILIFDTYQSLSGLYIDTLQNQFGCDSISIKELIVEPVSFLSEGVIEICHGDSVLIFNEFQNVEGIYYDTLQSQYGCDSIIAKELIVNNIPFVDFGYYLDDTLCLSNDLVVFDNVTPSGGTFSGSGITSNIFDIQQAGIGNHLLVYNYTSPEFCLGSDTLILSIEECLSLNELLNNQIAIYPNPTSESITIYFNFNVANLVISDINNKQLYSKEVFSNEQIDLSKYSKGIYLFQISTEKGFVVKRVIKT